MKKTVVFIIVLFTVMVSQAYGQHRVNDIKRFDGWYKINIELDLDDNSRYTVTQCYPNGDEYKLSDRERRQLPIWVKIFCIAIFDEIFREQIENLTFDEGGIFMKVMGFTLMIDSSKSDEDILEMLGQEMVNEYKYVDW
jgi:hypothetical protein